MQVYNKLLETYGHQGWWPIINNKTLICEYGMGAPRNEAEALEICIGAILTQGTQWYPNVVRAIQQLKLGRKFAKKELEVIRQAEILKGHIRERPRKQTTNHILTQNTNWNNVEKCIYNLNKNKLIDIDRLKEIKTGKLAQLIKSSGYYNQKAVKIKNFIGFITENKIDALKKLSTDKLRENLLSVNGIGKETADSIILYAFEKPIFVIDAYTKRIFSKLGMCNEDIDYDELQRMFTDNLNKDVELFKEYHALIVRLGKEKTLNTISPRN